MEQGDSGARRITSMHPGRRVTSLADDRRLSVCSRRVTGAHRRTTNQTAMRVSAAGLVERRGSIAILPAPPPLLGAGPAEEVKECGGPAHNCFSELPSTASDVARQLDRLMRLMAETEEAERAAQEADAAAAAAAAARQQRSLTGHSDRSSEASVAAEDLGDALPAAAPAAEPEAVQAPPEEAAGQAVAAPAPSKRLQWADGTATPLSEAPAIEQEANGEGSKGSDSYEAEAASQGERALRKGFQRRTWAGPAWVNLVASDKVRWPLLQLGASLRAALPMPQEFPAAVSW